MELKRKWIENKNNSNFKKGKFTLEEEENIKNALCEYGYKNNLSTEELEKLITEKQTSKKIWTKIAELIPNRTVNSIHSFCHRKFNPFNYKGKWTKKNEEKLLQLVWEKGKKWTEMAKIFERTPINCRDKYKSLGGDFYIAVQKKAKLKLDLKLLKAVENYLNDNNYICKLLNNEYKFVDNIYLKYNEYYHFDNDIIFIDNDVKDSNDKTTNKKILTQIININDLKKIQNERIPLSWKIISSKILCYSEDSCKNNWQKILNFFLKKIFVVIKIGNKKKMNIKEIYQNFLNYKRKR
jgi:hypothetical protein